MKQCVHFVGFRDAFRFTRAAAVFGNPDFVHYVWDWRAVTDAAPGDTVVFAKGDPDNPSPYSYDDSNQAGDPAAAERF